MKQSYVVLGLIGLLITLMCPAQAVNRTFTIDEATLTSIRTATSTDLSLIKTYWDSYTTSTREEEPDNTDYRDRSFTNSFGLETMAITTYRTIIRNSSSSTYLDYVRTCLIEFPWKTYERAIHHPSIAQNDVESIMINGEIRPGYWRDFHYGATAPAWYKLDSYQRGRELSYNTLFLSFMIDMVYNTYDPTNSTEVAQRDTVVARFSRHLDWIRHSFFADNQADWLTLGWQRPDLSIYPRGICYDNYPTEDNGTAYRMPMIGNDVNRFLLMCGLGYGAIVTGELVPQNIDFNDSDSLINFVKGEFVAESEYPVGSGCYGMNDYLVTNTGMYIGGITYQNRVLYLSPLFLTALNRVHGINLYNSSNAWNCDLVPKMVKNVMLRIDPELQHILQEDDWRYDGIDDSGTYFAPPYTTNPFKANHSVQIERGLLSFYYQNNDDLDADVRNSIRWYVHRLKAQNGDEYPMEAWENDFKSSFMVVMSYRAGADAIETDMASLPQHYLDGNYSNSELTILRKPLPDYLAFQNSNMLVVSHQNSFEFSHKNDDKTAFQLYLDGKPVIIEGGYSPAQQWKEWFRRASSQNLLLVNPDKPFRTGQYLESDYLSIDYDPEDNNGIMPSASMQFEDPSSPMIYNMWQEYRDDPEAFNPSRKEYLYSNRDISHLNVSVRYRNSLENTHYEHNNLSPQEDFPCRIERNFYSISDQYYLVLDKVLQEVINPDGNEYRSQLHFLDDTSGTYTLARSGENLGVFKFEYPSNALYIAMGSSIGGDDYSFTPGLPLGWRWWDNPIGKRQQRLSYTTAASTNAEDYFLTMLYPQNSTSPCPVTETISYGGAFGVVAQKENRRIISATKPTGSVGFPQNGLRIITDSKFFSVEADSSFSALTNLIIHKGNSIEVQDMSGLHFSNALLFSGESTQVDETIAEWHDNYLKITARAMNPIYPKYMILRCGVSAEHIQSSTQYGSEAIDLADSTSCSRGTIQDNIKSLAYDDQYFYVNYSWEDLTTAGLITEDLVIYKAIIPEVTISTDLNIQGTVIVAGNLSIEHHSSLEIRSGSTVSFADGAGIINSGTLLIDGGDTNSITLGQEGSSWAGIQSYWGSNTTCSNAIIKGAETGLYIRGTADITNNLIRDCSIGLKIESLQPFKVEYNEFTDNEYGAQIINTIGTSQNIFRDNEVWQNITGLSLYNSNIALQSNNIHHNLSCGIFLSRGSEPLIKGSNISNTECGGLAHPEIQMIRDSYPVIDDTCNDINVDGIGQSLYFSNEPGEKIKALSARNNYWGLTNSLDIQASIYPDNWFVDFEPYNVSPNTAFSPVLDNPLMQAIVAEEDDDIGLAKQLYYNIIDSEPDSLYALQSLGRLNSLYAASPSLFSDLRAKYSDYLSSCSDSLLIDLAQAKLPMLDRFDFQFAQAIQSYEDLLLDSNCEIDSILCLLDIAYTLQDMYYHDQTKGTNTATYYNSNGLQIGTLKEAKNTINRLWDLLIDNTAVAESAIAPVPTKLDLMNYPNPFNPSTTIVFGLPDGGEVRMSIYNIRGQLVRNLQNGYLPRGFHKIVWDGVDERNRPVSSGLYFIRIDSANSTAIKKVMLLK